jgi:protein-S-isoprenylcysteine O-methyltransferase Ste14
MGHGGCTINVGGVSAGRARAEQAIGDARSIRGDFRRGAQARLSAPFLQLFSPKDSGMAAIFSFLYGVIAYAASVAALVYLIGFSGDVLVPKSVDSGPSATFAGALCIDVLLLSLFAIQHSVMARQAFKRRWTRIVPKAVERSTYVLMTSLVLALFFWQWRPIPVPIVWRIENAAAVQLLWATFWLGWVLVLLSTFLINHFELFGLQQVFARLTGREMPAQGFKTPLLYRYLRHPLYLGILLSLWAVPLMTAGHLLFSMGLSSYIFVGIWFEERDLIAQFGERYRRYRAEVGMLVPRRSRL